jgi:hypothetical protein
LTTSNASLDTLLEICDPVEHKTKAERRAADRNARKDKDEGQGAMPSEPTNSRQRRAAERFAGVEKEKSEAALAGDNSVLVDAEQDDATAERLDTPNRESEEQNGPRTSNKSRDASLAAALVGLAVVELESDTEKDSKEPKMDEGVEAAGRK